eukprot:c29090_g1_i1 orf=155-3322(-)
MPLLWMSRGAQGPWRRFCQQKSVYPTLGGRGGVLGCVFRPEGTIPVRFEWGVGVQRCLYMRHFAVNLMSGSYSADGVAMNVCPSYDVPGNECLQASFRSRFYLSAQCLCLVRSFSSTEAVRLDELVEQQEGKGNGHLIGEQSIDAEVVEHSNNGEELARSDILSERCIVAAEFETSVDVPEFKGTTAAEIASVDAESKASESLSEDVRGEQVESIACIDNDSSLLRVAAHNCDDSTLVQTDITAEGAVDLPASTSKSYSLPAVGGEYNQLQNGGSAEQRLPWEAGPQGDNSDTVGLKGAEIDGRKTTLGGTEMEILEYLNSAVSALTTQLSELNTSNRVMIKEFGTLKAQSNQISVQLEALHTSLLAQRLRGVPSIGSIPSSEGAPLDVKAVGLSTALGEVALGGRKKGGQVALPRKADMQANESKNVDKFTELDDTAERTPTAINEDFVQSTMANEGTGELESCNVKSGIADQAINTGVDVMKKFEERLASIVLEDGAESVKAEVPLQSAGYSWPEWTAFLDHLKNLNFFTEEESRAEKGYSVLNDEACVKRAVFKFSQANESIFESLSRKDLKILAQYGCPSDDRRLVSSGKRLRNHFQIEEKEVCDPCVLKTLCGASYVKPANVSPNLSDVTRILTKIAQNAVMEATPKGPVPDDTKLSARRLLRSIIVLSTKSGGGKTESGDLSIGIEETNINQQQGKSFKATVQASRDDQQHVPAVDARGFQQDSGHANAGVDEEWKCPKCSFVNPAHKKRCSGCLLKRFGDASDKGSSTRASNEDCYGQRQAADKQKPGSSEVVKDRDSSNVQSRVKLSGITQKSMKPGYDDGNDSSIDDSDVDVEDASNYTASSSVRTNAILDKASKDSSIRRGDRKKLSDMLSDNMDAFSPSNRADKVKQIGSSRSLGRREDKEFPSYRDGRKLQAQRSGKREERGFKTENWDEDSDDDYRPSKSSRGGSRSLRNRRDGRYGRGATYDSSLSDSDDDDDDDDVQSYSKQRKSSYKISRKDDWGSRDSSPRYGNNFDRGSGRDWGGGGSRGRSSRGRGGSRGGGWSRY